MAAGSQIMGGKKMPLSVQLNPLTVQLTALQRLLFCRGKSGLLTNEADIFHTKGCKSLFVREKLPIDNQQRAASRVASELKPLEK